MRRLKLIPFIFALIFFFTASFFVMEVLDEVKEIKITASSPKAILWQVFYSASPKRPDFREGNASGRILSKAGEQQTVSITVPAFPVRWLRIDPGDGPGTVRLHSIVFRQRYGKELVFSGELIARYFSPGHDGVRMQAGEGYVDITATRDDPYLIANQSFAARQSLGFFVLPLTLLAFFLYQGLARLQLEAVAQFFWVSRELDSGKAAIGFLDGLRGAAALMVLADHTWPRFLGTGFSGVLIFFVLSGYLLAKPLQSHPHKMFQSGYWLEYGRRRLRRILPMYYFNLMLLYVLSLHLGDAILHALFLKGDSYLWAIPQEMLFYVVFPLLALGNLVLGGGRVLLTGFIFAVLAWASNMYLHNDVIFLYGTHGQPMQFLAGVFLSGCCAASLHAWYERSGLAGSIGGRMLDWLWIVSGCSVVALFLFLSNGYLLGNSRIYAQVFYGWYGAAAALLLLSLLCCGKEPVHKIFQWAPLRSLGVISFSFYLLHPLVLQVVLNFNATYLGGRIQGGALLFVLTLALTFPLAVLTYRTIELPFLQYPRS